MKKLIAFFIASLLLLSASFAQSTITINGTIANATADNIIVVNATSNKLIPDNKQEKIMLDKEGRFKTEIPVSEKFNWIILAYNGKRLDVYVESGSNLTFKANANGYDTSGHFEGKGADLAQYFADAAKTRGGIMIYYRSLQETSRKDPDAYKKSIDSIKAKEESLYDMAASKNKNIPKDFTKYWHTFLTYSVYDAMLQYPVAHQMYTRQPSEVASIPKSLYSVPLKVPKAFDDKYIDIPFYQTYIQSYYSVMLNAAGYINVTHKSEGSEPEVKTVTLQQPDSALSLIYKNMPPQSAQLAAGRLIASDSKTWTLEELEPRVAQYKKLFPKSTHNAELDAAVYALKKFYVGQPALDFDFTTLDGKKMKLSDLKGKVVYLDFWASWCGPCKGEMPYAKQVKEHFKDKTDVVFLYVSIDEKEDAWKGAIDAMGITGMHTRTSGWKGDIAQEYEIQSIPAYFLIDKKGNFAVKKTPRPSQTDEVIKLIEGLQ